MNTIRQTAALILFSLLLLVSVSASAQIAATGYDIDLAPGPNVVDNGDGTHTICDTFKMYKDTLSNQALQPGDFQVYEDDIPVQATITPPGPSGNKLADIIFCMDISGSMSGEIAAVKNNTTAFVNTLNQKNIDVQLGLITFGGSSKNLVKMNNGQFYASTQDFLADMNTLRASGGFEPWFDANALASQYPFRSGADQIIILVTDENGNNGSYNVNTSIATVKNNACRIYAISYSNLNNAVRSARETGGKLYNIRDPFNGILDDIAQQIANQYKVCYLSKSSAGEHWLKVEISQNGRFDKEKFYIGAHPVITLAQATSDMIANGVTPDGSPITIQADVTDDGTVAQVDIYGTLPDGTTFTDVMTNQGGSLYSFDSSAPSGAGTCLNFSIRAIDDEGRTTIKGPFKICGAANAPVISQVSPDFYDYNQAFSVTADVTDADSNISSVQFQFRPHGTLAWSTAVAMTAAGSTYSADIDAADAGLAGLDIKIVAEDATGLTTAMEKNLKLNSVPVTIVDVTRYTDTLDAGPYSVYAVVAGVDLNAGSTVTLVYSVNGGAESEVAMSQTVTGTQAALNANSNIYFGEIAAQNQGDRICYHVVAENGTGGRAQSPDICFDILQPVAALEITPASAVVVPGETVSFVATGGHGTYTWQTLNGTLSTTLGDTTTYTAVTVGDGWDKVVVTDIKGYSATAKIRVVSPLAINPDVDGKRFAASSTLVLTASGGEPGYTWQVVNASSFTASSDGNEVEVVLGADPAEITVTLTDSKGREVKSTFSNQGVVTLSPCCDIAMATGATQPFAVTGGQAPYAWTVIGGDLDDYTASDVTYTAPGLPGVYHVTVEDSLGDSATATLRVGTPLRVTPHDARIMRGDTAEFTVVSGVPPYSWEADFGSLSSVSGEVVTYTPENHLGLYQVTVSDSAGARQVLSVQVSEGIVVTPAVMEIEKNKSRTLKATGGAGGYTWSARRGTVDPMSGSEVKYTAPSTLGDGTDEVTVRDSAGNTATVAVTVTIIFDTLYITPGQATLSPGEIVNFAVHNAKNPMMTKWTATKGTIDSTGKYTAPSSSGTYTVSVIDLLNGRKADAKVHVKSQLSLTPDKATIGTNDSKTFTVSGGEAPYNWRVMGEGDLDTTQGTIVVFTASSKTGTSRLIVVDNTGISAEAEIEVTGKILITPASVTLAPGATQQFVSSGGTGTITWRADMGIVDSSGLYTAPSDIGNYKVTARDSQGNEAVANVKVGNVPVITPAMNWLSKGDTADFTVVGGTAPFAWTVTAGTIDTSGKTVTYTAPGVAGEVTVTVADSLGQESTAVVYVDQELRATKEKIYIKPGETTKIAVTGGIPPFDWSAVLGEFKDVYTNDAGFNFYTAPNVMGEDTITVRDSRGDMVTVEVIVTQPLQVTPNVRYMERGESKTFTAVSGVAPYTAIVTDGDGDITPTNSEDGVFTFTAGSTADDDVVIRIMDNSGQTVEVHAYVETTLKVSPQIIYVDKNATASFRVSGGTGGYQVMATSGYADVDADTGKGTYEAPSRYGDYTITVYDSRDESLEIQVEVARTKPVISPSTVSMEAGETRTFMVNMGAAPYEWSFEGGMVEYQDDDATTIKITAPDVGGTYKLKVEDAAGNEAEATVTINLPLLISPSSITVYQGTTPSIKVKAVGGTPLAGSSSYQWIISGMEENGGGSDYIVVKPSTKAEIGTEYSVECRDATGATAKMTIVVSQIPGDLNGDGSLSEAEMLNVIDGFFTNASVQGVSLDPELFYSHIEAFLNP